MSDSDLQSMRLSRLGIGTVQFGEPYGINNRRGKVPYAEILQILAAAREVGINFIDTAREYGSSEEELGKALDELRAQGDFIISTKLDLPGEGAGLAPHELIEATRRTVAESRLALRRDLIEVYLLHRPEYKELQQGAVWDTLLEERERERIRFLGVSISRGPAEALSVLGDGEVDAIQIPFNVLDQRWGAVIEEAARSGVAVFTRSAYLQGLLVMSADDVARKLPAALQYRKRFDEQCSSLGTSQGELALRYVFSSPGVMSTVVGIDSYEQFMENVSLVEEPQLDESDYRRLADSFRDVPEQIVNPAMWAGAPSHKENRT